MDVSRETFRDKWLRDRASEQRQQAAYEANKPKDEMSFFQRLIDPKGAMQEDYLKTHGKPMPTIRDEVVSGIDWLNRNYGPKEWNRFENTSRGFAEDLTGTLENTTPLGTVTALEEADNLSRAGQGGAAALVGGSALAGFLFPGGRALKGLPETHPSLALRLAEDLEKSGAGPDDVFKQTGYFRDAGDNWLYEYGDQGMKVRTDTDPGRAMSDIMPPVNFEKPRIPMRDPEYNSLDTPGPKPLLRLKPEADYDPNQTDLFYDTKGGWDVFADAEQSMRRRRPNRRSDPSFSELYSHPEQERYAPELGDVTVKDMGAPRYETRYSRPNEGNFYQGWFFGGADPYITAQGPAGGVGKLNTQESVALHEATHAGQQAQGLPRGSNPTISGVGMLGARNIEDAKQRNARLTGLQWREYDRIKDAGGSDLEALKGSVTEPMMEAEERARNVFSGGKKEDYVGYQSSEGEAMARLAQKRATLDPVTQGSRHPFRDLDMPPEQMFRSHKAAGELMPKTFTGRVPFEAGDLSGSFPAEGKFDWLLGESYNKQPSVPAQPLPVSDDVSTAASGALAPRHPVSAMTLKQPIETMTREVEPTGLPVPRRNIEWDKDLPIGSTIMPLYGDRTSAGERLIGINGQPLTRPVEMQGGSDFGRRGGDAVWASEGSRITTLDKRIQAHKERTQGAPVFGAYAAMGNEGGDFSHHQAQSVIDLLTQARDRGDLSQAYIDALDTRMRAKAGTSWPGLKDLGFDWLERPGVNRTALSKVLDTKPFQKEMTGGPDIGAIRNAITDPVLRDVPNLQSGHNVYELFPGTRPPSQHSTYPTGLGGRYVGSPELEPGGLPWDFLYRDVGADRAKLRIENGPRAGQPLDMSMHMRAFEMSPDVYQTVDQALIDALMQREEMLRQRGF